MLNVNDEVFDWTVEELNMKETGQDIYRKAEIIAVKDQTDG